MLERLKQEVCEANRRLVEKGLVALTWGNASGIDRPEGLVVIKPSGIEYVALTPEAMVVIDLGGRVIEGLSNPSVDTPTHLLLYKSFAAIGGVVHTHSHYATCFAQACRPIPCLGTTHADYFCGEVPVTAPLAEEEVNENYEWQIGQSIVRRFEGVDVLRCPAVLVANHGPYTWGRSVAEAVENASVLEEVARLAFHTLALSPNAQPIAPHLLEKHFFRKHGSQAYYGQPTPPL